MKYNNPVDTIFSTDTVARYLYSLYPHISPVKLQKSLYFLFAYYGYSYTEKQTEGIYEGESKKKYLFFPFFQAWKSGAVDKEIYETFNSGNIADCVELEEAIAKVESEPEAKKFIDELFEEIDLCSDFKLIQRNKQDKVWKNTYEEGQSFVMGNDDIIKEYKERY